jgi:hypothetical protein
MFPFKTVPANPFYSYPADAAAPAAAVAVQDVSRHEEHTLAEYKKPIGVDDKGKPIYRPINDRGVNKSIISAHGGAKTGSFFQVPDGVRIIGYVELGKPLICSNVLQTQICKNRPYISSPVSQIFNPEDIIPDYVFERDKKGVFKSGVVICNSSGKDGLLYNFDENDDDSRLSLIVDVLKDHFKSPFDLHLLTCLGGLPQDDVLSVLLENASFFTPHRPGSKPRTNPFAPPTMKEDDEFAGKKRKSKKGKKVKRKSKKGKRKSKGKKRV